jgi:hypothetical protein
VNSPSTTCFLNGIFSIYRQKCSTLKRRSVSSEFPNGICVFSFTKKQATRIWNHFIQSYIKNDRIVTLTLLSSLDFFRSFVFWIVKSVILKSWLKFYYTIFPLCVFNIPKTDMFIRLKLENRHEHFSFNFNLLLHLLNYDASICCSINFFHFLVFVDFLLIFWNF